jgi:hypothetical protein
MNDAMEATHARSNSIVMCGTFVVPSYTRSMCTTSARTDARSTTLAGIDTLISACARPTYDAANPLRTRATKSTRAIGSRLWSLLTAER